MPENKVKNYFRFVQIWTWCDICKEHIEIRVDKDEILNGLETGIYTKEYSHVNPYPDLEDPDDPSVKEHTLYVYINQDFNVTGVKSFFGESPSMEEFEAATPSGEVRIPIVVKDIPVMSVNLGMITQDEYVVLKICDGMNTIEQVAEIAKKSLEEIEKMMDKLRDKGLVKVIKRA